MLSALMSLRTWPIDIEAALDEAIRHNVMIYVIMRSCARNVEVKTVLNQTWPIEAEEDFDEANWKFSHGKKSNQKHV